MSAAAWALILAVAMPGRAVDALAGFVQPSDRLPEDPREPDPPPEPTPDPPPEPTPTPTPTPEPTPEPTPGTGDPDATPRSPASDRVTGAPNVDAELNGRTSAIELGGDVIIKPRCNDKGACNGGRVGFKTRFPITQESATGGQRAGVDALNGFTSSWRVGVIGEYIRDITQETGPAKFLQIGLDLDWGVQTFKYYPLAGGGSRKRTRHSIKGLVRVLGYIHEPRRYRIAPQLVIRYDRNWAGAAPIGVVDPGDGTLPATTRDVVTSGPLTRPVLTVNVPVLFTIQRGGKVLPQLGFGPTVRYAFAGDANGYNPFGGGQTLRGELWLYWYPTGQEGLDVQKTNVRIGAAPYVDAFLVGRTSDQVATNFGGMVEVRVGVRGYEY